MKHAQMPVTEDVVNDLSSFPLGSLGDKCAEETKKFLRQLENDTRYCFELFRRAVGERNEDALSQIYRIYRPLLKNRAWRHSMFESSCQDADYFASVALGNFYRANQGEAFLIKFKALAAVIAYLYSCLHSAIAQDVRDNPELPDIPDTLASKDEVTDDVRATDVWRQVCEVLPDSADQLLAYLRFVLQIPPAEIAANDPDQWESPRAVSVALQRIRRQLRNDDVLRNWFGDDDEEDDSETDDNDDGEQG
jgi:hypothetical protein